MMRRPNKVVSAQRLEPLVLLTRHPGRLVPVPAELRAIEFADDLGPAELLLVGVDLVAAGQPEDAEGRLSLVNPHAIANDPGEEVVKRVMTRDISDIASVHQEPFPAPTPGAMASNSAGILASSTGSTRQAPHGPAAASTYSQSCSASDHSGSLHTSHIPDGHTRSETPNGRNGSTLIISLAPLERYKITKPAKHVECSIRSVAWHGPVMTPNTPQTRGRPARRL